MMMCKVLTRTLLSTALAGLLLGGCASSQSGLDTATAGVAETRAQLTEGKEDVSAVLLALQNFRSQETVEGEPAAEPVDLTRALERFGRAVRDLEATAERVGAQRDDMEARLQDHIVAWRAEIENISNEQAREISTQRMARLEEVMGELGEALDDLNAEYQPFLSNLRDIETMLGKDLSRGGIAAIQPIILDVSGQAADIQQAIATAG